MTLMFREFERGYAATVVYLLGFEEVLVAHDHGHYVFSLDKALDAEFKQWYRRVADLPGLSDYLASRPQVGEGTFGMPGSILHSGVPRVTT